jgi:serine/threonine protein kinase
MPDEDTLLNKTRSGDPTDQAQDEQAPPRTALMPPPPESSIPPREILLNTYEVERFLARGGMGEVYLARHTQLHTRHAIKVIAPELVHDQRALALTLREATVLRGIRNDAVVGYDGFFQDDKGRRYLVTEFVDGPSLSELLERRRLTVEEIYKLRDRLLDGLAAAHAKQIIHRDIAPDNIIIPDEKLENAKLIDFGIAKLADPAVSTIIGDAFAGKYRFASPEQLKMIDAPMDARSDLYSLGLVLVAAALGKPLEMGKSFETACRARGHVPDLSRVPPELRPQLSAMLKPRPSDRPQSAKEILETWPGQKGKKSPAGSRLVIAAGATLVLGLAGSAGYFFWPDGSPRTSQQLASDDTVDVPASTETIEEVSSASQQASVDVDTTAEVDPTANAPTSSRTEPTEDDQIIADPDETPIQTALIDDTATESLGAPVPKRLAFTRGSTPTEINAALELCRRYQNDCEHDWYASERQETFELKPFRIDPHEVTSGDFARFVTANDYVTDAERQGFALYWDGNMLVKLTDYNWRSPDGPDSSYSATTKHPASHISYNDAQTYCRWVGGRLPSEAEWELAARGSARRIFPWGNDWDADKAVWNDGAASGPRKVGSRPGGATATGIQDMAGNLWEWTTTREGDERVLKGGSWLINNPANLRAAARLTSDAGQVYVDNGFRCVYDVSDWDKANIEVR